MAGHDHAHSHHITPISQLIKTGLILAVLMVVTIAWAQVSYLILPQVWWSSVVNNFVAMGIACIKAWLVIQVFMGVKFQSNLVKTYAILGFVWFTLMFSMFADYGTRRWEPVQGWTPNDDQMAMPRASEPFEPGMPPREKIVIPEKKGH